MLSILRPGAVVLALFLAIAGPPEAAAAEADPFKSEIDSFLGQIETATNGVLKWQGSEKFEVREEAGGSIAVLTNARLMITAPERSEAVFDRIEIRRQAEADGKHVKMTLGFPPHSTLKSADGTEVKLTLTDATASAVIETQSGRARETALSFAGARLAQASSGSWINFGPLSLSSKLAGAADGSWTAPVDFELKAVEFFFPQGPFGGVIERIGYSSHTAGPSLAEFDKLRDRIAALRTDKNAEPQAHPEVLLAILGDMPAAFSRLDGEVSAAGVAVRAPTGQPLVAVTKASLAVALTGLSSEAAALRVTVRHDGLKLAPSLIEEAKVPHRVVVDLGLENISTAVIRSLVEIAGETGKNASDKDKQHAMQQAMGAAAMLNPVFRIYHAALDTKEVGVDATATVKGSPLSPKGYSAEGDVAVRGVDALPPLLGSVPFSGYLPLLKEIGSEGAGADGSPRIKFHLASAPQHWITINGNDVSVWFADDKPEPGRARLLRPAQPPMRGEDVRAVQRALAAANIAVAQDAVYDPATAVAVARFQKQNGLAVTGVVDAATRQKLALAPPPGGGPPSGRQN